MRGIKRDDRGQTRQYFKTEVFELLKICVVFTRVDMYKT